MKSTDATLPLVAVEIHPLYDAWTNNFANPGLRDADPEGETLVLVGPGTPPDATLPAGLRVLPCPTDLVWLIPRVLVGAGDDVLAARATPDDCGLDYTLG